MYQKIIIAFSTIGIIPAALAINPLHNSISNHSGVKSPTSNSNENITDFSGTWHTEACGPDKQTYDLIITQHYGDITFNGKKISITPLLESSISSTTNEAFQYTSTARQTLDRYHSLIIKGVGISKFNYSGDDPDERDKLYVTISEDTYSLVNPSQMKVVTKVIATKNMEIISETPTISTCIFNKINKTQ